MLKKVFKSIIWTGVWLKYLLPVTLKGGLTEPLEPPWLRVCLHANLFVDYVAQYTSDIRHVKGEDNVPAHVMSYMQTNALLSDSPPVIDFRAMAAAHESDPDFVQMRSSSSLTLEAIPLTVSDSTILCDTSTSIAGPFVPAAFRCAVFESLHSLSHPRVRATQHLVTS